jgi:hypothetical protein
MKRMLTLLSVAVFATVFAAGCGKHKECADAGTKKAECAKDKFEENRFETKCTWLPNVDDDAKGKCEKVADAKTAADESCTKGAQGAAAPADDKACADRVGKRSDLLGANKTCKMVAGTPNTCSIQ